MGDDVTTHGADRAQRQQRIQNGENGERTEHWELRKQLLAGCCCCYCCCWYCCEDLAPLSFPVPVFLLSNGLSAVLRLSAARERQIVSRGRDRRDGQSAAHCGQGTLGPSDAAWVAIQVVTLHLNPNKNAFDVNIDVPPALSPSLWAPFLPRIKQIIEIEFEFERRLRFQLIKSGSQKLTKRATP